MGGVHHQTSPTQLKTEFDAFVQIPATRQVSAIDNELLMSDVCQNEVIQAIAALNRHKAAAADGLNNEVYGHSGGYGSGHGGNRQRATEMWPTSSIIFKRMIIPLRKHGDSDDAMDYRPIALLQPGYKIFTKVVATRLQTFLGKLIGHSQQGFIHGRQMKKTVMMMMTVLTTSKAKPALPKTLIQAILLLDFRKAYDLVAWNCLFWRSSGLNFH